MTDCHVLDSGIGWLQGDAERAGQFGEEWKRTREVYGGLWDSGVEAWQESEERNGIGGAMEMQPLRHPVGVGQVL